MDEKKLTEEVIYYINATGARPIVSGEWIAKEAKKGKTLNDLIPTLNLLIEEWFTFWGGT